MSGSTMEVGRGRMGWERRVCEKRYNKHYRVGVCPSSGRVGVVSKESCVNTPTSLVFQRYSCKLYKTGLHSYLFH